MAQTTGAINFKDCVIELSTDGSTWTDISGHANSISMSGGERQTGESHTMEGDTPIILPGKRGSIDVTVSALYTETAGEAFELARAAYEGGSSLYVRWSPRGGQTGEFQYTSSAGIVTNAPYPVGEAGSPDPVAFTCTLKVATITQAVVA